MELEDEVGVRDSTQDGAGLQGVFARDAHPEGTFGYRTEHVNTIPLVWAPPTHLNTPLPAL